MLLSKQKMVPSAAGHLVKPAAHAGWPVSVEAASDVAVPVTGELLSSYFSWSLVMAPDEVVTVTKELGFGCEEPVGVAAEEVVFFSPLPGASGLSTKDGGSAAGHCPLPSGLGSTLTMPNFPGLGIFSKVPLGPVTHWPGMFAWKTGGNESMSSLSSVPPTMLTGAH